MNGFELCDPTRNMSPVRLKLWRSYRQATFRTHERDELVTYRIEDFDGGLPEWPDHSMFRWLAAHWGIDPFQSFPALASAIHTESVQRKPCVDCGCPARGRTDWLRCDPCLIRETVADINRAEANRKIAVAAAEERELTARFIGGLSPNRRRLLELSGQHFNSPAEAFLESHGEYV